MRFRSRLLKERGALGAIDIAPLIDIVFQLLIFFMLTSNFIVQPGIHVNLPGAATSEVLSQETKVITITAENLLFLDGRPVGLRELWSQLASGSGKNLPLLIRADRKASMGRVVEVWDACRKTGIRQINIATNQVE